MRQAIALFTFPGMEWKNGEYLLDDDKQRLDLDAVMGLLAMSYWANDRPRSVMD